MPCVMKPDCSESDVKYSILGVFTALVVLSAQPLFAEKDAVLMGIDSRAAYRDTDYQAFYTVVQRKPDQGESTKLMKMLRRDSEDKFVLLILKPDSERGKGILNVGTNVWKYDPVKHRMDVTSPKEQLFSSNARLSDFKASTLARDYQVVSQTTEPLGRLDTRVLTLEAQDDDVTFPKVKLWITSDQLIR